MLLCLWDFSQTRILKLVAISFSSTFRDWIWASCFADGFFTSWASRETPHLLWVRYYSNYKKDSAPGEDVGFSDHTSTCPPPTLMYSVTKSWGLCPFHSSWNCICFSILTVHLDLWNGFWKSLWLLFTSLTPCLSSGLVICKCLLEKTTLWRKLWTMLV